VFHCFGVIGGFATLSLTICAMVRGTLVMAYKSLFVLQGSSNVGGLGMNACQLGCVACCKICGGFAEK